MIIVMTESSDQERESIKKDLGKVEEEPKEMVVDAARQLREVKKPTVLDYKRPIVMKENLERRRFRRATKLQIKCQTKITR
jgi:hypothetical protein